MRCRVGDLAVVIKADLPSNLGNIVRIVAPFDGSGNLVFTKDGPVWAVECQRRMTWELRGKLYCRKKGPVPDNRLQPIRGVAADEGDRAAAEVGAPEGKEATRKAKRFAAMADQAAFGGFFGTFEVGGPEGDNGLSGKSGHVRLRLARAHRRRRLVGKGFLQSRPRGDACGEDFPIDDLVEVARWGHFEKADYPWERRRRI